MTSSNLTVVNLAALLRTMAKAAVTEAVSQTRTTRQLAGTVEDLQEVELDVAWIRMDSEAMSSDPTQSDNWGEPGVIPTTRLGETFAGEQVRTTFDGSAGATSIRTSALKQIVVPFGAAEDGEHIRIDGNEGAGYIAFFNDDGEMVGYLDANQWFMGTETSDLVRLDPIGGLRLWDDGNQVRVIVSTGEGLQVRDGVSGITGVAVRHDGIIVADPVTGETISIASGSVSATPAPHWASSLALSPGTTHSAPAISSFATADDLDLRFVSASAASALGAQSYTPPAGFTEQTDVNSSGATSLATSLATKDPADAAPSVANFTNTSAAFTRKVGHGVIVRGGGGTSPAIGAVESGTVQTFTTKTINLTINAPASVANGDLMVAHVALAGPAIPVGWTVPEGWKQLGVQASGLGTTHILGSGVWYRKWETGDPTSEVVSINMTVAASTKVHATVVRITNPYAFPGGLDIRRNNRSMPRGQVGEAIGTTATTNWANAALPQTVETISNIDVLVGRTYRIAYDVPNYTFNGLAAASRFAIDIEMDTGSGFTLFHTIIARSMSINGTETGSASGSRSYIPSADQTISLRTVVRQIAAGTGFNIQLSGSAGARRWLYIDDVGAAF